MPVSPSLKRTPDEEIAAQALCFADCSQGNHLDPENGVLSKCASVGECKGWVPYLQSARDWLNRPVSDPPSLSPGLLVEGGDLVA